MFRIHCKSDRYMCHLYSLKHVCIMLLIRKGEQDCWEDLTKKQIDHMEDSVLAFSAFHI